MKRLFLALALLSLAALPFGAASQDVPSSCFSDQLKVDVFTFMNSKLPVQRYTILKNSPGPFVTMNAAHASIGAMNTARHNDAIACNVAVVWAGGDGSVEYVLFEERILPNGLVRMNFVPLN